MPDIAWMKTSAFLAASSALWVASMSPAVPLPTQALCLVGALATCGFAVSESRRSIPSAIQQRVRAGLDMQMMQQEMAIAASSMEQAIMSQYFPGMVEHPQAAREQLEQMYAASPECSPELYRAVKMLANSGYSHEGIAREILGVEDVAKVGRILKFGEEQGW